MQYLDKVLELTKELGVLRAGFIIICVGIACNTSKVMTVLRGIIKDWRYHNLKLRELNYKIEKDKVTLGLKLEKYENKTSSKNDRKEP
jgi:hypothetical protein